MNTLPHEKCKTYFFYDNIDHFLRIVYTSLQEATSPPKRWPKFDRYYAPHLLVWQICLSSGYAGESAEILQRRLVLRAHPARWFIVLEVLGQVHQGSGNPSTKIKIRRVVFACPQGHRRKVILPLLALM